MTLRAKYVIFLFFKHFDYPGEYASAAELYREVLRSSEEHKEKLKTDSLQVSKTKQFQTVWSL